jgi:hypothetical protein
MKACVLLPVYNDWPCLPRLLREIDRALSALDVSATVVIINDGGDPPRSSADFTNQKFGSITDFQMIELIRNVGNQNALVIGLSFIRDQIECDVVIVMDSDGQDSPSHLGLLLSAHRANPEDLITAERGDRSEGRLFRMCYWIYRRMFMVLTGKRVTFGNFSVIPSQHLARLCIMAELPINFAAALIKSRLPIHGVPCHRGGRYDGVTSQNFVNLIIHGINGVSVFSEIALVRVSLYSAVIILCTLVGIAAVAAIRFFTDLAIVGWATNVVGFLLILMFQALLLSLVAIMVRVQRPMSLFVEPGSYKLAIASVTSLKAPEMFRATA